LRPVNAANAQNFTGAYDSSGNAVYRDSAPVFSLAGGGPISGPGTATSDSIFARLSNGEYVIKAAAVQKYGLGFMHALNNMHLPKFANGGAVARAAFPAMNPLMSMGGGPSGMHRGTFPLPDGSSHEVFAPPAFFDSLVKLSLQHRKRR
jgi:hypothetical protein